MVLTVGVTVPVVFPSVTFGDGVADALAVGLGVLVTAFFALGVAEGEAVGVSSIGVGVIKITSKEGVGGIGETSFCWDLTKKYIPTMTTTIITTGMMNIQ